MSLEARLSGNSGPLRRVGGLYAFEEDQEFVFWVDQGYRFNQTGPIAVTLSAARTASMTPARRWVPTGI
jgi:hypothetical protein